MRANLRPSTLPPAAPSPPARPTVPSGQRRTLPRAADLARRPGLGLPAAELGPDLVGLLHDRLGNGLLTACVAGEGELGGPVAETIRRALAGVDDTEWLRGGNQAAQLRLQQGGGAPLPEPVQCKMEGAPLEEERSAAAQGLAALVRPMSPLLAATIEQGIEPLKEALQAEVTEHLDVSVGGFDVAAEVNGFLEALAAGSRAVSGAAAGDQACCEALPGWIEGLQGLADGLLSNTMGAQLFDRLKAGVDGPLTAIGEGGAAFTEALLEAFAPRIASTFTAIQDGIEVLRGLDEALADEISLALGLGDAEGGTLALFGRLWDEVVGQALAAVQGVVAELVAALFALPGVEALYRLVDLGIEIVEGVQWLRAHLGDPDLVEAAHREMGGTWVPGFVDSGMAVVEGIKDTGAKITAGLRRLVIALASTFDVAVGVPILQRLASTLSLLWMAVNGLLETPLWGELGAALDRFGETAAGVFGPYGTVLLALGEAMANPLATPRILLSTAFTLLPDCYKGGILDALATFLAANVDQVVGLVCLTLPGLGPPLGAALHAMILGAVAAVHALPVADKLTLVSRISEVFSPEAAVQILGGVGWGLGVGVIEQVIDGAKFVFAVQTLASDLLLLALTWPAQVAWWLAGGAVVAFDDLGDAHYKEDEFSPEAVAAATPLAQAGPTLEQPPGTLWDLAKSLAETFEQGIGDLPALARALGDLWDVVVAGLSAAGGDLMGAALEAFFHGAGDVEPWDVGVKIGKIAATIFAQYILTAGAGAVLQAAPKVAAALQACATLLAVPDLALGALMGPASKVLDELFGLAGSAAAFLKRLGGPAAERLLALFNRLVTRWGSFVEDLRAFLGVAAVQPDAAARRAAVASAREGASAATRALLEAAGSMGDDKLLKAAEEALLTLDRESRRRFTRAELVELATQELDGSVKELIDSVAPPKWYVPTASPIENLQAYVTKRVKSRLKVEINARAEGGEASKEGRGGEEGAAVLPHTCHREEEEGTVP